MVIKNSILNRAIDEAEKSKHNYRIGAVVFKGAKIFGVGHNAFRSNGIHPKYQVWKGSLHAEQAAVLGLDWAKLKGTSMLVVRVTKTGKLAMAKPCQVCMSLINYLGIKNLYYSDRNGTIQTGL